MTPTVYHILDIVKDIGIEATQLLLADFSTRKSDAGNALNEDIEAFLKFNAIQFAREKKSMTYMLLTMANESVVTC